MDYNLWVEHNSPRQPHHATMVSRTQRGGTDRVGIADEAEATRGGIAELSPSHTHPAKVHLHRHWHVAHLHRGGVLSEFEHQSYHHTHEHSHAALSHSHEDRDPADEVLEHKRVAHVHDHADPAGVRRIE